MDTGEQMAVTVIEDSQSETINRLKAVLSDTAARLQAVQAAYHHAMHNQVTDWTDCRYASCYNSFQQYERASEGARRVNGHEPAPNGHHGPHAGHSDTKHSDTRDSNTKPADRP